MALEGYTWTFARFKWVILTKVTRISVQNKGISQINNLMIKVGRIQFAIMGIILSGLFIMGKEFLYLWLGNNFKDSYYVSMLLILPGIITFCQEIAYNYLIAINEIKYRAYGFIGSAFVSLGLSLILTKYYGAIGAAIAINIGVISGHIITMNIIYYKVLK